MNFDFFVSLGTFQMWVQVKLRQVPDVCVALGVRIDQQAWAAEIQLLFIQPLPPLPLPPPPDPQLAIVPAGCPAELPPLPLPPDPQLAIVPAGCPADLAPDRAQTEKEFEIVKS